MYKTFLVIAFAVCSSLCSAQVFNPVASAVYTAFDTNGPMGECLFPMDNKCQEVVACEANKDDIGDAIQAWSKRVEMLYGNRVSVNHFERAGAQITFDVQLYLGSTIVDIPWVGDVEKQYSEVQYKVFIELKDQKYRITFFDFYTDRVTLKGEAKSNGPSNMIHWQRINSLAIERDEVIGNRTKLSGSRQRKVDEYNNRINMEKSIYQEEWNTVCSIMKELKECTSSKDDF